MASPSRRIGYGRCAVDSQLSRQSMRFGLGGWMIYVYGFSGLGTMYLPILWSEEESFFMTNCMFEKSVFFP